MKVNRLRWGLTILSSLVFVLQAQADATIGSEVQNSFFQLEENVEFLNQSEFQKNKEAVFRLLYKGPMVFPVGSCTNTMISDEGHFITALHCIRTCLDEHDAAKLIAPFHDERGMVVDGFMGVDYGQLKGKKCRAIDPNTNDEILLDVVAVGPGASLAGEVPIFNLASLMNKDLNLAANVLAYGIAGNLDFAILKRTDANKPNSCVSMTSEPMGTQDSYLNNQKVWTLSYPSSYGWTGESLSDGKTRLYSEGTVLASYKEDPRLVEFAEGMKKGLGEQADAKADLLFDMMDMKVTTLPATPGSSGASVFNSDNEIAGIVSFVFQSTNKDDENAKKPGNTYVVSASAVRDFVTDVYSDEDIDMDKVFKCTK